MNSIVQKAANLQNMNALKPTTLPTMSSIALPTRLHAIWPRC
jgi:hypothetical protein